MAIYIKSFKSMLNNINLKYVVIIFFTLLLIKTHLNLTKLEKESLKANYDPSLFTRNPKNSASL